MFHGKRIPRFSPRLLLKIIPRLREDSMENLKQWLEETETQLKEGKFDDENDRNPATMINKL
jgi:hypothetical protein